MDPGTIRKPSLPIDPTRSRGKPKNILEIIQVVRVKFRGKSLVSAILDAHREQTYQVSSIELDENGIPIPKMVTMKHAELAATLSEVAKRLEPNASKQRVLELVDRMISRAWSAPALYVNRRTGETTT